MNQFCSKFIAQPAQIWYDLTKGIFFQSSPVCNGGSPPFWKDPTSPSFTELSFPSRFSCEAFLPTTGGLRPFFATKIAIHVLFSRKDYVKILTTSQGIPHETVRTGALCAERPAKSAQDSSVSPRLAKGGRFLP